MTTGTDLFNLDGKRALITGSSQGIGFALAKGLAAAGAGIFLSSNASSFVNGHTLYVDGGVTASL